MNNFDSSDLVITHRRVGAKGTVIVTVKLPYGPPVTHKFDITSASARDGFLERVCDGRDGVDRVEIGARLDQIAAEVAAAESDAAPGSDEEVRDRPALLAEYDDQVQSLLDQTERDILRDAQALLDDPKMLNLILRDISAFGVVGESELAVTAYILGASRLLDKPLAAIVQGLSSTGKSFVPEKVSTLFPVEAVVRATDITPNALYYMKPGRLIHRWVVAGERPRSEGDERAEGTRAMREMLASGELRKLVTVKARDGKGLETREIWQPGPIAFIESTTITQVFDEDANRCLLVGTDESQEQTARIVHAQAQRAAGHRTDTSRTALIHQTVQRLLRRVGVVVPYAVTLARAIPTAHQNARRAMPHVLSVIQAVALLNQRRRAKAGLAHGDVIVADIEDYVIARRLLLGPMSRALGRALPDAVVRFAERLIERYEQEEFTSTEACKDDPILGSKPKVNEYLRTLGDAGVATCTGPNKGPVPATWKMTGEIPDTAVWLPTVDAVRGLET